MEPLLLIGFAIRQTFIRMPEPIIMPKTCEGWYQEIDNNDYVNKEWLKRIMFCESTCRFDVINTSGRNKGLMQFDDITFNENCEGRILNGKDQLRCADNLYSKGQAWRWECK